MNIVAAALIVLGAALQDGWRDTHRVYLRNGNFVDCQLQLITKDEIIVRWNPHTTMRLRTMDLVKIEEITIRTVTQEPKKVLLVEEPKPSAAAEPPDSKKVSKEAAPKNRSDLAQRLARAAGAPPGKDRDLLLEPIRARGLEGARSLVSELSDLDAPSTRVALAVLDGMKDLNLESELRSLLSSPRPDVRTAACDQLSNRGATGALRAILSLLRDPSADVRIAAIGAAGNLGDEITLYDLADLIFDSDARVRTAAIRRAEVLSGRVGRDPELARRWIDAFGWNARQAAAEIAGSLGRMIQRAGYDFPMSDAEARLVEILSERDDLARSTAALALGALKSSDSAASAILAALDSERKPQVVVAMCEALGRLKMPVAVEALVEHLRSETTEVRQSARRALETITGATHLGAEYDHWKRWFDDNRQGVLKP